MHVKPQTVLFWDTAQQHTADPAARWIMLPPIMHEILSHLWPVKKIY